MNKIVRLIALAAVVGTAVLSYSLPQTKAASAFTSLHAIPPAPTPMLPWSSK